MRGIAPPVDPGPAGWAALLPQPAPATPLEGAQTADWLVIGAGFAGLAAARRLSQLHPGDRITVLEAARVAEGPAGRNSGFMIDLPHDLSSESYAGRLDADRATIQDNRRAISFARDMTRAYGLPPEAFAETGKTNAAASARGMAHNAAYAAHLTALGEPFELRDAAQMQAMTGTAYYQGGLYTPGTVMLQPALFVRGVATGLASNRVQICEQSPVTALERKGYWIATTPKGQVTAPRVILAVNGHLQSFGFMAGQLMHVFTYASMSRALSAQESAALGGAADWGVTPADPLGTTVRRTSGPGGDRITIRNRFTFDPSLKVPERRLTQIARSHDRAFAARFPMLEEVTMQYRWGGRLCLSRNGVQVIGEIAPQLYAACCQNGLGTVRGTLAGLLAAEAASGVPSAALTRAAQAPQPKHLPPGPIAQLGAALRLKWGEARAGREF